MITAVLTRPRGDSERLAEVLQAEGVQTVILPLMTIESTLAAEQAIAPQLTPHSLVVFISANAVRHGLPLLKPALASQPPSAVIAIGSKTQDTLEAAGITALMPARADSEGLLAMPELSAQPMPDVLIVKGEGGRELLATELRQRGAQVIEWSCYRRCWPEVDIAPVRQLGLSCVFQASSGEMLSRLSELLTGDQQTDLFQLSVIVPSRRVADLAAALGWGRIVCAADASDLAFSEALRPLLSTE